MSLAHLLNHVIKMQIAQDATISDHMTRGEQVARYRRYADGDHDNKLTDEMRDALRIGRRDDYTFTTNYMPVVINALASRVSVSSIISNSDAVNEWAQELLDLNLFDRLQDSVHRAAIRDGNTFVLVWWDGQRVRLTHEEAFDGTTGVIPIYYTEADTEPRAVIKVWQELLSENGKLVARTRINSYSEGMVRRYISPLDNLNNLMPYSADGVPAEQPWTDKRGAPMPLPFVHFKNKERGQFGISEIESVITLQDALNRTLASLLIAAEKHGFSNRAAFGFEPPASLEPGGWIAVAPGGLGKDQEARIETLPAGDLAQLRETLELFKREIATTSATPLPEMFGSDNLSGEAFRQREASLLSKAESFRRQTGAAWEQVLDLAWLMQNAHGQAVGDYTRFATRWQPADLRSEKDTVANAIAIMNTGAISRQEFLRLIAPVYGWDEARLEQIQREAEQDAVQASLASTAAVPDFRAFMGVNGAADS